MTFWNLLSLSIFDNIFGDLSKSIKYFVFQTILGKIPGKAGKMRENPEKSVEIPETSGIFENSLE